MILELLATILLVIIFITASLLQCMNASLTTNTKSLEETKDTEIKSEGTVKPRRVIDSETINEESEDDGDYTTDN